MNAMENNRADPMEMSYLLGIAGGCLTAVLLLVCLCIYAIRARKCCFKGKFASCLLSSFQMNFKIFLLRQTVHYRVVKDNKRQAC